MRETIPGYSALAVLCAILCAALPFAAAPARAAQPQHSRLPAPCVTQGTAPYLHTCGPAIEDFRGNPVRLMAVNWYGFESNDFVAAGLDRRAYRDIIDTIKALGYNALRLPFSNEMVEKDPVVSALTSTCPQGAPQSACRSVNGAGLLAANPDLAGLTSLQILKAIVDYAGSQGLYVFLDDHRSRAGWGSQEDGVWYDTAYGYSQQTWLDDWRRVALLFTGDPALTGVDLFNEPHSLGTPTTCAAYLFGHGASWGSCGGQSNPQTDWHAAATQAGDMLLGLNPNLLIVVEGVSVTPNATGTFDVSGGGANLEAAGREPVQLSVPGRLVYSVHQYFWARNADATAMLASWSRRFGYLMNPTAPYAAPVWIGEFGTCNNASSCVCDPSVCDSQRGSYGYWLNVFMSYLNTPPYPGAPPFGWAYWALNGTSPDAYDFVAGRWARRDGDRESFGLFNTAWSDQSLPALQGALFSGEQLSSTPAAATPEVTSTPTPVPSPTPPAATPTPVGPRQLATLVPDPVLSVSASGTLAGGATFALLVQRDRSALLRGTFPYTDRAHHLSLWARGIDGLNLSCLPSPRAEVTGAMRDARGRSYFFTVWIAAARAGYVSFALRLSGGYHVAGLARGRAAFSCSLGAA